MKRKLAGVLAGVLAVFTIELHAPAPADACGVKLTIKASTPRKAVARTSRPSHVLLIGSPPRRLEHDLTAAGHDVESSSSPAAAKRDSYAVVIVDNNEQAAAARQRFTEANVIVRSGDAGADLRSVEDRVARRPERVATARAAIKTSTDDRTLVAAGPDKAPKPVVVAVKEPTPAVEQPAVTAPAPTPAPTPTPAPAKPAPERIQTPQPRVEETPAPREKKVAKASASELHDEVYFGLGSAQLANKGRLAKAVKWLTENSDVHVVVEGHADPSGSADANMALSQSRAEGVRDYLVSNGVDGARIEVIPYGDTKVKYGRTDGRNRRVALEAKK